MESLFLLHRSTLLAIRARCKKLLNTRNSPEKKIVNMNFLYDDIVHAVQNTIDSCIRSATDRRGYVLEHRFTKFSEITQCNGHYAVRGHSRSPILVTVESSYDFLLVINTTSYLTPFPRYGFLMVKFSLASGECLTLTLSLGMILCQYRHKL